MGGAFWIPFASEHRGASGLQAGQEVEVTLELDTAPREVVIPDDLQAALAANQQARAAFETLSYSNKRRYVLAIEEAKTPETRTRRVQKVVAELNPGG